jgi:hypothetical protein
MVSGWYVQHRLRPILEGAALATAEKETSR